MNVLSSWRRRRCGGGGGISYLIEMFHLTALNTLWTGDADLRFYITTVQDGWRKSAFLTRACFPRTVHLITQK
jgi:hypothetical protein